MSSCHSFNMSVKLNSSQEYIQVKCVSQKGTSIKEVYTNMHAIVANTPRVQAVLDKEKDKAEHNKLSVLLLGIDSISRLNLHRTMPSVVAYLEQQDWQELRGYNKIGDNTFPNLMAILTGMSYEQIRASCLPDNIHRLDDCPFVWKNFAKEGFITAYMEDQPLIGSFNHDKPGFLHTPTDYYPRPFMLAAQAKLKSPVYDYIAPCLGPTYAAEHVMRYIVDFATTFINKKSFGLFWMNTFSHADVNTPSAMEDRVLKLLRDLSESGAFNSSLVVFFSDHGSRFGPIRKTYVGWLEERLPFIYIWMPQWYRYLYPDKYTSLQVNRERLTSPYDLGLTLQEVLNDTEYTRTIGCPRCQSLFHEMPWNRSCEDAGISEHWCTCCESHSLSQLDTTVVVTKVSFVLKFINNYIINSAWHQYNSTTFRCAKLAMKRIVSAREKTHASGIQDYVIVFETIPGEALFEATLQGDQGTTLSVIDSVSRINMYNNQSACVKGSNLKKYCFCTNSIVH